MRDQLHAALAHHAVTKLVHRAELPGRIHLHQRKRRRRRIKRLSRQMQHDRGVLGDRVRSGSFSRSATTSRKIWMLPASRCCGCVRPGDGPVPTRRAARRRPSGTRRSRAFPWHREPVVAHDFHAFGAGTEEAGQRIRGLRPGVGEVAKRSQTRQTEPISSRRALPCQAAFPTYSRPGGSELSSCVTASS